MCHRLFLQANFLDRFEFAGDDDELARELPIPALGGGAAKPKPAAARGGPSSLASMGGAPPRGWPDFLARSVVAILPLIS